MILNIENINNKIEPIILRYMEPLKAVSFRQKLSSLATGLFVVYLSPSFDTFQLKIPLDWKTDQFLRSSNEVINKPIDKIHKVTW